MSTKGHLFARGMRDGIPVGLGYLAVGFSLGITAKAAGLDALQGFFASLFTIASAGEYAGFRVIAAQGAYLEMALVILVANCRYLLMSCALSQRVRPGTGSLDRLGMGMFITDELFALNIAGEGPAEPLYAYGAALTSVLPWAAGTALGIVSGSLLPAAIVNALSVALYGMFLAIIIPPARKNRVILGTVLISFLISFLWSRIPFFASVGEGFRIILLTAVIAGAAAVLFPVKEGA